MTDPSSPRTLLGWVLPFILVSAAALVHWSLDVPAGPLPPPGQKEGEAKKPAPPKPAAADPGDDDKDKDREADEPFTTPRTPGLLTQLWDAYDNLPFASEPTFEVWNTAHKPRVTQLITTARMQLFKGRAPPPSVSVSSIECHTVRCRFTLTTNAREDLEQLITALEGLRLDGATLWHKYVPDAIVEEPPKRAGAAPRWKSNVVIAFIRDLPPIDLITFKDGAPIRPNVAPAPAPDAPIAPVPPSPSTTTTTTSSSVGSTAELLPTAPGPAKSG